MNHIAQWRPMLETDLDAVMAIADAVHADHPEDRAVFADRLTLFPQGCRLLAKGCRALGYAVAHPIRMGRPAALNAVLERLAPDADCLHLHDLALLPEARGSRFPAAFVATAMRGSKFPHLSLIAIDGLEPYWRRFGFAPSPADHRVLATYDAHAVYMIA